MDQYFTQSPKVDSDPKTWQYTLKGNTFTFTTDNGVFSKHEVDYGSRVLIDAFQVPNREGSILDLGCGYGPISLALAASYPARHIVGVDINERAIALADYNRQQNKLTNITFKQSDQFTTIKEDRFAAILTNPPIRAGKEVVHGMFEEAREALLPEGELWAVIQKKQGAPSAKKKLEELFGQVDVVLKDKGYYILQAKMI